jgi:hypothetical protein
MRLHPRARRVCTLRHLRPADRHLYPGLADLKDPSGPMAPAAFTRPMDPEDLTYPTDRM